MEFLVLLAHQPLAVEQQDLAGMVLELPLEQAAGQGQFL
jgi:hypothetical protein